MDEDIVYSPKKYRETEGTKVITLRPYGKAHDQRISIKLLNHIQSQKFQIFLFMQRIKMYLLLKILMIPQ